jgi:hypothetical protein
VLVGYKHVLLWKDLFELVLTYSTGWVGVIQVEIAQVVPRRKFWDDRKDQA